MTGLATIPGHHFQDIERAGPDALCAADAGVVNLDGVGHAGADQGLENVPSMTHPRGGPSLLLTTPIPGASDVPMDAASRCHGYVPGSDPRKSAVDVAEQLSVDALR